MKIVRDFDVSQIFYYNIGGKAKFVLECENKNDVVDALGFVENSKIKKVFICGLGSNLIFTDGYYDGAIIRIVQPHPSPLLKGEGVTLHGNGIIEAFAGVLLDDVIQFAFKNNLIGLEWAGGLPGTVGAAVRGNVGAFGGEIEDNFISAEVLDYSDVGTHHSMSLRTIQKQDLQFVYRGSIIKTHKQMIVISATFALQKGTAEEIKKAKEIYQKNIQYRNEHHPLEYPNCGSVFKNLRDKSQIEKVLIVYPELRENVERKWYGKVAVASLLEKMGLKGYRVGDAQISEKHALFIVNLGQAKAKDVLQVIHDIQEKFRVKFGFSLETEVEIVK